MRTHSQSCTKHTQKCKSRRVGVLAGSCGERAEKSGSRNLVGLSAAPLGWEAAGAEHPRRQGSGGRGCGQADVRDTSVRARRGGC